MTRASTDRRPLGRAGRYLREILLSVGAVLGLMCILSACAALFFGITPLVVRSGSMAPDMPTGSLALASPVRANEVAVGDVVSVTRDDGVRLTHRVHDVGASTEAATLLTLKGDANSEPDSEPVVVSEVDRVFLTVPRMGYIVTSLQSPTALALIGICFGALVFTACGPRRLPGRSAPGLAIATAVIVMAGGIVIATGFARTDDTVAALTDSAVAEANVRAGTLSPPANYSCKSVGDVGFLELSWDRIPGLTDYQLTVVSSSGTTQPKPLIPNPDTGSRVTFRVERHFLTNSAAAGTRWSVELRSVRNNFVSPTHVRYVLVQDGALGPRCALNQTLDADHTAAERRADETPAAVSPTASSGTATPEASATRTESAPTTTSAPSTQRPTTTSPTTTRPTTTQPTTTTPPTTAGSEDEANSGHFATPGTSLTSPSGKYRVQVIGGEHVVTDSSGQSLYSATATKSARYGYGAMWLSGSDELWILTENSDPVRVTFDGNVVVEQTVAPQSVPAEIAAILHR